jgi:hypothetical protein
MAKKWITENLKKLNKVLAITVKPVLMATSKQRPAVNNDWSDPQSANIFHDHPLDNGHFRTTASFFSLKAGRCTQVWLYIFY